MEDMVTAAVGYATLKGWPVLPVDAGTKYPLTKHGFKDASRDERLIREWWRRWPTAGVALAIPDGLLVLDVDPRNGGERPPGLPFTKRTETRSGGQHYYYRVPAGLSFVGQLSPGVDVKAPNKGYVLLPPTPGYTWAGPANWIAELPKEYLARVVRRAYEGQAVEADSARRFLPWENGTPYGLKALANAEETIRQSENGERNNALFKAAVGVVSLVAGGELAEDNAATALFEAALGAGLDSQEIERTLASAYARGIENPRRAPE